MNNFPQPHRLGGATRWCANDLHKWESRRKIKLPALTGMVTVKQVASRYGISESTIWRWLAKQKASENGVNK